MSIPVGSIIFTGYGDSATCKFYSPSGIDLGQPSTTPIEPGSGVDGIVALASGKVAIVGGNSPNFGTTGIGIFNSDLSVDLEGAAGVNGFPGRSIARDDAGNFYGIKSSSSPNGYIMKYDVTGVQVQSWNATDFAVCLAVNGAGTIAYYVNFATPTVVRAWDLSGDTDLGVFTTEATFNVSHNAILSLTNGDVLVAWKKGGASGYIKHYNSAGTLLYTYTLSGTDPAPIVLSYGLDQTYILAIWYDDALGTFSGVQVALITLGSGAFLAGPFAPNNGTFEFDSPATILIDGIDITPTITDINIDCVSRNIVITGTDFPMSPTVTLTVNGASIGFTIIFSTSTQIVVHPNSFINGNWCALVQ